MQQWLEPLAGGSRHVWPGAALALDFLVPCGVTGIG